MNETGVDFIFFKIRPTQRSSSPTSRRTPSCIFQTLMTQQLYCLKDLLTRKREFEPHTRGFRLWQRCIECRGKIRLADEMKVHLSFPPPPTCERVLTHLLHSFDPGLIDLSNPLLHMLVGPEWAKSLNPIGEEVVRQTWFFVVCFNFHFPKATKTHSLSILSQASPSFECQLF